MDDTNAKTDRTRRWDVGGWLVVGLVVVAVAVMWRSVAPAPAGPELVAWRQDATRAFSDARTQDRLTFLYFTADWCPPCRVMKAEVYSDPQVAALLNEQLVPVKVDMTAPGAAENAMAMQFGVAYLPTMLMLSPGGQVIDVYSGPPKREAFTQWLNRSLSGAALLE